MGVFRKTYTPIQRKYFDMLFYTTFLQIVRLVFDGADYRYISFRQLSTSSQKIALVTYPEDLDRVVRRCFGRLYTPSPFQFLVNILLYTNADDVFQARRRLDELERQRGSCTISLHHPVYFNVYGSGFFIEGAKRSIEHPDRRHRAAVRTNSCPRPCKCMVDISKNARVDEQLCYRKTRLFKIGLARRQGGAYVTE